MSVSFEQAREVVQKELGVKASHAGFYDDKDYNVLVSPPFDDEVVLVNREDGTVHREVYFLEQERLQRMLPITDQPLPPAPKLA